MKSNLDKFKEAAALVLKTHGNFRSDGAIASLRTQQLNREVIMAAAERLARTGNCPEHPNNLKPRHIQILIIGWVSDNLAAKTIQNNTSRLRRFCFWIGKPELVPDKAYTIYAKDIPEAKFRVITIAIESKSWSENGINIVEKILAADKIDLRFGAMLRLGFAFGFRRKEQLRCRPHFLEVGGKILVRDNISKSGKERSIPIEHPFQRAALEYAKRIVNNKNDYLGWPNKSYKQNYHAYSYLLKTLGISGKDSDCVGHGMRAEYAENIALMHGLLPPVLGGKSSQMEVDARLSVLRMVAENMGHHRPEVTGSYYGSFRNAVLKAPISMQSATPVVITGDSDGDCVQIGQHRVRMKKDKATGIIEATIISMPIPFACRGESIAEIVRKIHEWDAGPARPGDSAA